MKKMNFLLQVFAALLLIVSTSNSASAQIYQKKRNTSFESPTKTIKLQTLENCDCGIVFSQLSDTCKEICKKSFSEIVIHDNISIGGGNPHGNDRPWMMRIGSGKLPFLQVNKEGGIGIGTTLFPLEGGGFDLGSHKKPFRQVSALKFAEISDRREKENIVTLPYGLKDVLQLKPVSFTWKSKAIQGTQVGLIAQEVQEIIPEIVISQEHANSKTGETSDRLSVAYSELVPVLIHAIQEQQAIIETQKQQLNEQQTTVSQLIEILESQGIRTQKVKTKSADIK